MRLHDRVTALPWFCLQRWFCQPLDSARPCGHGARHGLRRRQESAHRVQPGSIAQRVFRVVRVFPPAHATRRPTNAWAACTALKNQDDPGLCSGTCDKNGDCKSKQGQTCQTVASGCAAGTFCSPDGYCCDKACTGSCEACDIQGALGTCTTLAANATSHLGHTACNTSELTCAGSCNGNSAACFYPSTIAASLPRRSNVSRKCSLLLAAHPQGAPPNTSSDASRLKASAEIESAFV
jgi:hypothetical protein